MDWVLGLLRMILEETTPQIRQRLVELIGKWEQEALATPNKIDDMLVWLVKKLLLIN